jgi:uncharacterized protein (TIRG00374 family)
LPLLLGTALGAVFLYLALRGVEAGELARLWRQVNWGWVVPAAGAFVLMQYLRSLRWEVIMAPVCAVPQRVLFPINSVGGMAIALLPMRLGELVRPWLAARQAPVSFGAALGTIVLERVFDVIVVLAIFALLMPLAPLADWLVWGVRLLTAGLVLVIVMLLAMILKRGLFVAVAGRLLRRLPVRLAAALEHFMHRFVDGVTPMTNVRRLLPVMLLSAAIWATHGLAVIALLQGGGLKPDPLWAFTVLLVTHIGISIPGAPGHIGNFQYACMLALLLFGVGREEAFFFSLLYYGVLMGTIVALGLVFLPAIPASVGEFFRWRTARR